jgi:hypothetical protein
MNVGEQADFLAAMAKVAELIKSTQAALQRARSLCHGEIFDEVDLMSKRLYELKVKAEWVRFATEGKVALPKVDAEGRHSSDRRLGLDRRVAGMQKQMLAATGAPELKRKSSTG